MATTPAQARGRATRAPARHRVANDGTLQLTESWPSMRLPLPERCGFCRFVACLLPEFGEIFDWRVIAVLNFRQAKTRGINIGFVGLRIGSADRAARFVARTEGDELFRAGEALEIIPFLARYFLLARLQ